MSDLLTHVEESVVVDVDLDIEPQCEQPEHKIEHHGIGAGPAEYVGWLPCGKRALLCAPLVNALIAQGWCTCATCGEHKVTAANFIAI